MNTTNVIEDIKTYSIQELLKVGNVLIQWEGGGYSGCIWEPNTGFITGGGDWVPLISTGYAGRDTMQRLVDNFDCSRDIVYPITEEGLLNFQNNIRADFFVATVRELENNGYEISWKCSECSCVFSSLADFGEFGSYTGDGGIGIISKDPLCTTCTYEKTCDKCNERCDKSYIHDVYCGNQTYRCCDDCFKAVIKTNDVAYALQRRYDELTRYYSYGSQKTAEYTALKPQYTEKANAELQSWFVKLTRDKECVELKLGEVVGKYLFS